MMPFELCEICGGILYDPETPPQMYRERYPCECRRCVNCEKVIEEDDPGVYGVAVWGPYFACSRECQEEILRGVRGNDGT